MQWRIRKLSTQMFLAHLVILTASTAIGFLLFATTARGHLDDEYQARAAVIAQTFAQNTSVQSCLASRNASCDAEVQKLALATAEATSSAYVVVIDQNSIRVSHPNSALIGKPVSEPLVATDGQVHLRVNNGSTGTTANAIAPLYSSDHTFIGEVSVGIEEDSVSSALLTQLPSYGVWFVVMLLLGGLASFGLSRLLKKRTFGLELDEIARLLQEREATLHGIREGVIAIDPAGRISVNNDEAQRLLSLADNVVGHRVEDVLPPGPVRDALTGTSVVTDQIMLTDDFWIVVNRMPVTLSGQPHGVVVTLQDRTVVEALSRELDGERSLTESMRAQQHEFSNRMHGIAGLLELGRPEEALEYVNEIRGTAADLDQTLRSRIAAPQIVGLMLGKAAEANERGIQLTLDPETFVGASPDRVQALTTILGNLIDNAFDAVAGIPAPRRVRVGIVESESELRVSVSDNGPGVPTSVIPQMFRSGYSTKRGLAMRHSGIGLSLVQRAVAELGGTISVAGDPGASFLIVLPRSPALAGSAAVSS
ncbi:sensor histidine kinase [Subtercola sp. PAMC28395]|uniref:sensor histidine kinase n=1 Tax=Subtercola sp. PAMC28395 TaxID=2846775 RepID=UPI001C0BBA63|nr:sensor histidine kinase [Subtercola sp. PAMC28395]QWT25142.1 sensor histidine kinase [Subtercola sp. PAMC28395]